MYIMGVDPTADWTSTPEHALGQLGANITDEGTKTYRYVKLRNESATVAVAAGDMLAYLGSPDVSSNNDELHTVVSDNTDAATKPVGAGMAQATVAGVATTSYYGWVQVSGHAVANQNLAGTPADGDALYLSTTDKTLTLATAADDPVCAYAIDDSADRIRLACN